MDNYTKSDIYDIAQDCFDPKKSIQEMVKDAKYLYDDIDWDQEKVQFLEYCLQGMF